MFMIRRIIRSWHIFTRAMILINQEKKLLIFPLISFLASLLLMTVIFCSITGVTLALIQGGDVDWKMLFLGSEEAEELSLTIRATSFVVSAMVYLFAMFVANFCSVAFYSEIMRGLCDEPVSVRRGFGYALYRLKAIFLWSVLASTVGMLLKFLEERAGLVGKLIIKFVGMVWAVASVFAIPALVCDAEMDNPFRALKRSTSTIANTWGEMLTGFAGITAINWVSSFLLVLVIIGLVFLGGALASPAGTILCIGLGIVAFIVYFAFCYLVAVAQKVYIAALYLYATTSWGADCVFDGDDLGAAFYIKGSR